MYIFRLHEHITIQRLSSQVSWVDSAFGTKRNFIWYPIKRKYVIVINIWFDLNKIQNWFLIFKLLTRSHTGILT